jgi:hypothetical protein
MIRCGWTFPLLHMPFKMIVIIMIAGGFTGNMGATFVDENDELPIFAESDA